MTSKLKTEMPHLVASIVMVPFLAVWPFLSAFPVFSLIDGAGSDFSTFLNVIFMLTGFWSLAGGVWIISWLTDGRLRAAKSPHKMLLIGGYSVLWTAFYTLAAMWSAL